MLWRGQVRRARSEVMLIKSKLIMWNARVSRASPVSTPRSRAYSAMFSFRLSAHWEYGLGVGGNSIDHSNLKYTWLPPTSDGRRDTRDRGRAPRRAAPRTLRARSMFLTSRRAESPLHVETRHQDDAASPRETARPRYRTPRHTRGTPTTRTAVR